VILNEAEESLIIKKMYKTKGTHNYYVYILTNKTKTVLYIGITNSLKERLYWHRNPDTPYLHFTQRYRCYYLIYHEQFQDAEQAILREKQLKGWRREKKENLIKGFNPDWHFLNDEIE
jgi:putative endonuclease